MRRSARIAIATAASLASAFPAAAQVVSEQVLPGVVRFFADQNAKDNARPSIALQQPLDPTGPAPAGFATTVDFTTINGRSAATINTPEGTTFYGTGMVSGPLERSGRFVSGYNFDAFGYGDFSNRLYQTHPWVIALLPDGSAVGVLADTTERIDIDLTGNIDDIAFAAEGPEFPVYVVAKQTPQQVMTTLADLTGYMPMPPLWSIGYHQCRYSYFPDDRVLEVAQEFRNRNLPADVIWMDIDYMEGFRVFTFDDFGFPNPAQLNADLDNLDFQNVWMINPGVKIDSAYAIYNSGNANDVWVNQNQFTNTDYSGQVWPGDVKFPDFLRQQTRQWWADLYQPWMATGIDGVWNDMNEPTVFNDFGSPDRTFPPNAWHRADADLGGPGNHARYHNVFGMQMIRATRDGVQTANPDKRPFVLTRANFIGGHRYGATWTGDNVANEYHLDLSIPIVLNLGLSGQPFSGPDIGGFNGDGSDELFARWMGIGNMLPFARNHTAFNQRDKEPWTYGPEIERVSRLALQRRYRLIKHIYTAFFQAHTTGIPVARPLFFADPTDSNLRFEDDAFLLGDGLIVSTGEEEFFACGTRPTNVALPDLPLYQFGFPETDDPGAELDTDEPFLPQLFLIGGHIIPAGPIIQSTREVNDDQLTLIIALDTNGEATGVVFEDDGDGYGYLNGDFALSTYTATTDGNLVTVQRTGFEGNNDPAPRPLTIRLLTADNEDITVTGTDGTPITIALPEPGRNLASRAIAPGDIDGCNIPDDFTQATNGQLIATQGNPASSNNNVNELNQLFARADADSLDIGITGNLGPFSALAIFIDSIPGGQNTIDVSTQSPPPQPLPGLNGLAFDEGFNPDRFYLVNTNDGTQFWIDELQLPTDAPATKTFRGTSFQESAGALEFGDNPLGMRIALSRFNDAGVTAADTSTADTATSGIELEIPLPYLGLSSVAECDAVKITAVILNFDGSLTNQILPSAPPGTPSLGIAPDLAFVPGSQFTLLSPTGDINGDGDVGPDDLFTLLASFGTTTAAAKPDGDLDGDGSVGPDDLFTLLSAFGPCAAR